MTTKEFKIAGMSCTHCIKAVEIKLSNLEIENKEVGVGNAKVTYDESQVDENKIIEAIEEAGYKVV